MDWRFRPVDLYTLLQGIIERCLATQQPNGEFYIPPIIYNKDWYTAGGVLWGQSYAPICRWIERDYPGGVLQETSEYVNNLLDAYPRGLILQAIDERIVTLATMGYDNDYNPTGKSIYGNLKDAPPYWEAFHDETAIYDQAGVGYDPVTHELLLVPARASPTGEDIYGPASSAIRIYPEMLIARYKVLQQMRYKMANYNDARRMHTKAVGHSTHRYAHLYGGYYYDTTCPVYPNATPMDSGLFASVWAEACADAKANRIDTLDGTGIPLDWTLWRGCQYQVSSGWSTGCPYYDRIWRLNALGYGGSDNTHSGPRFNICGGYEITHTNRIWGYWDGDPSESPSIWKAFGGGDIVAGKNLLYQKVCAGEDDLFESVKTAYLEWPPFSEPWGTTKNYYLNIVVGPPIEDWEFQFCKHDDYGGEVTWVE
jgi:hypothetical protein